MCLVKILRQPEFFWDPWDHLGPRLYLDTFIVFWDSWDPLGSQHMCMGPAWGLRVPAWDRWVPAWDRQRIFGPSLGPGTTNRYSGNVKKKKESCEI